MELGQLIVFFCLIFCGIIEESNARRNGTRRPPNADEMGNDLPDEVMSSDEGELFALVIPWPDKRIPYVLDRSLNYRARNLINQAMQEFHNTTCIRFVPRTQEMVYIIITSSRTGCYSGLGYKGKIYNVNLANPSCIHKGIILHELAHVIGLFHEQSRKDRDNYVTINWDNIEEEDKYNFEKYSFYDLYEEPYNYDSIMHYSEMAFSKNRQPTIEPKNDVDIGQRDGLSQGDIITINRRNKCPEQPITEYIGPTEYTVDVTGGNTGGGQVPVGNENPNGQLVNIGGVLYNRNNYNIVTLPDGQQVWYSKSYTPTPAPTTHRVVNPYSRYTTNGYNTGNTGSYTPGTQYPYSGYYTQRSFTPQYTHNGYYQPTPYPGYSNVGYYPQSNVPSYPNVGYYPQSNVPSYPNVGYYPQSNVPSYPNVGYYPQSNVPSYPNNGYYPQYTSSFGFSLGDNPQAASDSEKSNSNTEESSNSTEESTNNTEESTNNTEESSNSTEESTEQ